ncbi:hypothetical protein [Pseudomonas chlororaphis]|uniref:hypothetical protein n=1 Tax=Pseudomonas chlororaphis TaxID=587753 RepID=UPI000F54F8E9|nr:hypothetical protein [Pseudomonas chlororaphis]
MQRHLLGALINFRPVILGLHGLVLQVTRPSFQNMAIACVVKVKFSRISPPLGRISQSVSIREKKGGAL